MKKRRFLLLTLASLLLVGCGEVPGKVYDPYADRYVDGLTVDNTYKGDKKDFYLQNFYPSDAGGVISVDINDDEYHVTYNKSSATSYANIHTTVIGRFSDFSYLNIRAKGNLGQPISIRAFWNNEDDFHSNVFGTDAYISIDSEYKVYSLKVKKSYITMLDLLCDVAIYPEIGQASAGDFYFDKVWFSSTLPEGAIWSNEKVDSGGDSIIVNGWETFPWTNYNIFPLGIDETGLKYVKAEQWANIQHLLSEEEEARLTNGEYDSFRFIFKDNVDILNRKTISAITFKLVGDKIGEGKTEEGYDYNIYQEYVMHHYVAKDDYDSHVGPDGYVTIDIPFSSALIYIGDLHKDGYYFSMMIESDPGYIKEYQFNPDGDMSFKSLGFSNSGEEIDLYSQGAGQYQYVLSDKEGVEKNIAFTNMPAQTYWPRVERLVLNSKQEYHYRITLMNNSDHEVKVGVHAGIIDGNRSDAKNNNFFPLWSYGEKNADGYYTDGKNYFIDAHSSFEIDVFVDYEGALETDKIEVIQFLMDNCWSDEEIAEREGFVMSRTGDIDVLSVEKYLPEA
ncbi:MAG: hypothetical protein IJQ72_03595 [Bacilli bacterium]|nr:hypothetical protein [Bacilli bacterium]